MKDGLFHSTHKKPVNVYVSNLRAKCSESFFVCNSLRETVGHIFMFLVQTFLFIASDDTNKR